MHFFPSLFSLSLPSFPFLCLSLGVFLQKSEFSRAGKWRSLPSSFLLPFSLRAFPLDSQCAPSHFYSSFTSTRCKIPILFPLPSQNISFLAKVFPGLFLPSLPCAYSKVEGRHWSGSSLITPSLFLTLHSYSLLRVCSLRHFNVSLFHSHSPFHQIGFNSQLKWEGRKGSGSQSSQSLSPFIISLQFSHLST